MAFILRQDKRKKGIYLQMYENYWDRQLKQPRNKCIESFGYVDDLVSDEIPALIQVQVLLSAPKQPVSGNILPDTGTFLSLHLSFFSGYFFLYLSNHFRELLLTFFPSLCVNVEALALSVGHFRREPALVKVVVYHINSACARFAAFRIFWFKARPFMLLRSWNGSFVNAGVAFSNPVINCARRFLLHFGRYVTVYVKSRLGRCMAYDRRQRLNVHPVLELRAAVNAGIRGGFHLCRLLNKNYVICLPINQRYSFNFRIR